MRKGLILSFLFVALFLLAGCGTLNLEINKDGSGNAEVILPANEWITKESVEEEVKSQFEDEEGISKVKVKEKKGQIIVTFRFDDVSRLDNDTYQLPVGDLVVINDTRLVDLVKVNDKYEFKEGSSDIFLQMDSLSDFNEVTIKLPGKILAHSDNVELTSDKELKVTSGGDLYIVYKQGSSFGAIILSFFFIAVVAVAIVLVVLLRKKPGTPALPGGEKKEGDSNA